MNFDEIKAYHEKAKAAGFYTNLDLKSFGAEMQQKYPDRDFGAAQGADNWVGSMSRSIDAGVEATGLPTLAGNIAGFVGSGVDSMAGRADQHYENLAQSVGKGLPRTVAQVGAGLLGTALAPETGGAGLAAWAPLIGTVAGIADAGVKSYADTGSVKQGVSSALLMGLAPGIGSVGSTAGLSVLGKYAPAAAGLKIAEGISGSGAARVAASQIGEQGAFLGAIAVEQAFNGHDPFTVDNLFANAIGAVGFAPLMAHGARKVYRGTPRAVAKTWKPELGANQDVMDVSQDVQGGAVNNITKLTDYLLGASDTDIPNLIHQSGGLRQALELTGLEPVGMSPEQMTGALGQRMRGKQLVEVGANDAQEFGSAKEAALGAKGPVITGPSGRATVQPGLNLELTTKAAELLQTDDGSLVGFVKMLQTANALKRNGHLQQVNDVSRLEQVGDGQQTVKGKVKPRAVMDDPRFEGKNPVDPSNLPYQREVTLGEEPIGLRPKAVKGKVKSPEQQFIEEPVNPVVENPAKVKKSGAEVWAERKIAESKGNMNMGLDPELLVAYGVKGAYHIARGVRDFAQWSGQMVKDFGDGIKPQLEGLFARSQELHGKREEHRDVQFSRVGSPLADSEVFRFVKGPITHDGNRFLQLGSSQVGQSGTMAEARFQSSTQMPKEVFGLVKQVYPEAFDKGQVNVNRLRELEKERPMFETKVYGQDGEISAAKAEYDQMTHDWFETHPQNIRDAMQNDENPWSMAPENNPNKQKYLRYKELASQLDAEPKNTSGPRATSYYNTISPFDTEKYPVVRVDVVVPGGTKPPERSSGDLRSRRPKGYQDPLWRQDDLHENLPNTLGWAMVQFVPDPRTGETVMFVAEQQSRWGQDKKKNDKILKETEGTPYLDEKSRARHTTEGHPLLDLQHKLVLKAAMDEARKRGVTKMVVSDGETAMMTEGHDSFEDRNHEVTFKSAEEAKQARSALKAAGFKGSLDILGNHSDPKILEMWPVAREDFDLMKLYGINDNFEPSQAGGMRQHYDSVLQSAAEKMTRSKGESVDMGVHKNAIDQTNQLANAVLGGYEDAPTAGQVIGSPIFRNADGTPKTTATGKMYDIAPETVENVRYSKLQEPTGADARGVYTAESLRVETERLNNIEATPDMAVARMMQKVKNRLAGFAAVADAANQTPLMYMMSEAFDSMGLHPTLKEQYTQSAQKVADFITVGSASYGRSEVFFTGRNIAGAYFPNEHAITLRTDNQQRYTNPEHAALDAIRVLAHESSHALHSLIDGKNGLDSFRKVHLDKALAFADSMSKEERINKLTERYVEIRPDLDPKSIKMIVDYAAKTPREFVTEYGALWAMTTALKGGDKTRNSLRFVPEPLQNFVKTLTRSMHEIIKMVKGSREEKTPFDEFHKSVEMLYTKDPVLENMKTSIVKALQAPAALEAGDFAGNGIQYSKVDLKVIDTRIAELTEVRQSNSLVRNIMQHMQIGAGQFYKQHFPSYQKLTDSLARMDSVAVTLQHSFDAPFMIAVDGGVLKRLTSLPDGKLTPDQLARKSTIIRVESSEKMVKKFNEISQTFNELMESTRGSGEPFPTFTHPDIQAKLSGLSSEQIGDLGLILDGYLAANNKISLEHKRDEIATMQHVAVNYLLGAGTEFVKSKQTAVRLFDQVMAGQVFWSKMPDAATGFPGELTGLPPELATNPGVLAFMKHWDAVKPAFDERIANLDRPHLTEFRSGMYGVRYDVAAPVDGWPLSARPGPEEIAAQFKAKSGYRSTNNAIEWKAIQRDVMVDPKNSITELLNHKKDPKGRFGQMQTRGLEEAINLVRANWRAAKEALDPVLMKMFDEAARELHLESYDPAAPLVQAMRAGQGTLAKRTLAPGREHMNFIEAQKAFSSLNARKLANNNTRRETNWLMKDPSWDLDKNLKDEMNSFRNNVLGGGRQDFQTFRKLTTLVVMGGNVASGLTNATQPLTMGVWRATQEIGVAKALKFTVQGLLESVKPLDKITDAGFKSILVEAINSGLLKTGGAFDNFMTPEDTMNYNVLKAGSSRDMVDLRTRTTNREFLAHRVADLFSQMSDKGMEVAMTPMRLTEQLNSKNSLWVGYKLGLEQGLTGRPLYDKAVSFMQTVNLQGQRTAHSSFKMKAGQANGFVEAATLMTNYPIAMFSEMMSSWQGMLKSSGLDAQTRKHSAQAFAGQLLTQMAFAGVAGVGIKGLFAVAKDMFGVDVEDEIRQSLAVMDESGTLGELVLNGAMNTLTGADIASRYDLGGVGGLNPYTGFDAKGLFGAGGGMLSALYNAPSQIANGDVSKIQLIPAGFRRMVTAFGDDAYRDTNGQQIIDPTVGERFTQMIGFKPARAAAVYEQRNTMRNIEKIASEKNSSRKTEQLQLLQHGAIPELTKTIQDDVMKELSGPEYANHSPAELRGMQTKLMREHMLELVNFGVDKILPFDSMSQGTGVAAMAKNASAAGFGNQLADRPSEETRTVLKQQMLQKVGMQLPRNAPKAVRDARKVDEHIRANPQLTRSQAVLLSNGQ